MSGWDSYRAVHGAELRAAERELHDHGWPVASGSAKTLLLATGLVLDVLELPAAVGRLVCGRLRDSGAVVPVAADPTGSWWFPVTPGAALPLALRDADGVRLHTAGAEVLAPPSQVPDGWVHWRVAPAQSGYRLPAADLIFHAAADVVRRRAERHTRQGAQRPVGALTLGWRS